MMTLAQAAGYFDRTPVLDPDTGFELFRGQVDPYDDSKRDAGAAYRRVMSVRPGTVIPASRAVSILGQPWLVGHMEADGLADPHREKYVLAPATAKVAISRLSGFLTGAPATTLWAGTEWVKNAKEIETSSKQPEMTRVYLPLGSDVRERDVVSYTGYAYLALAVHTQPSGFSVAECLRLEQTAPAAATVGARTYVPGTGFAAGSSTQVQCLRVRWQNLFEYGGPADDRYQEGDAALALPTGTVVTTRDKVTFDGIVWQVLAVDTLAGAVVVHARRGVA